MDKYFVWDGNPILLDLGEFVLPYAVSVPGFIAAAIIYYLVAYWLTKPSGAEAGTAKKSRRKQKDAPPGRILLTWQKLALGAGALVVGQLFFLGSTAMSFNAIGPIEVRWYGFFFAISFLTGFAIGNQMFKHAGKPPEYPETLFMYLIVGTILGARLGHVIFYDLEYYLRNSHQILYFWQGGLASHGAVIGVVTAIWLFARKHADLSFMWVADRMVIPFTLGGVFVRTGNFFNSEILGRETDVSWAVIFLKEDLLPRHPSMLYEAVLCLILFAIMVWMYRYYKNTPPVGSLSALFLGGLFLGRFLIEYTKERQPGFDETLSIFSMGQWLSIPMILIGVWLAVKKVNWSKVSGAPTAPAEPGGGKKNGSGEG